MRFYRSAAAILTTICLLFSCSSARKHSHDAPLLPGMTAKETPREARQRHEKGEAKEPVVPPLQDRNLELIKPSEVSGEMLEIDDSGNDDADTEEVLDDTTNEIKPAPTPKKHEIPFEFNQKVADWIQYFSQKDRDRFQRFLDRGEPYREVIENILEENQVPADLYYLGMIESGFSTHAKSVAKAAGVWQFMRSTGKIYGLSSDRYVDERLDPIRATEAAAKMLRDLYRDFHSWPLAMAAYNAGPGRIRQAIRRGHSNDFWELVAKRRLPRETMEYVPKFLAARYIGENPDLFAFYINEEQKYPDVELVKVPAPVPFERIEKSCGMPDGTLAFVNPQFLKPYTHPGHRSDQIWVPENFQKMVEAKSPELASYKLDIKATPEPLPERTSMKFYVVKRGDNLKNIARRRGLSVAYLKGVNGLRSDRVVPGQRLKLSASSYHQRHTHPRKHRRRRKSN